MAADLREFAGSPARRRRAPGPANDRRSGATSSPRHTSSPPVREAPRTRSAGSRSAPTTPTTIRRSCPRSARSPRARRQGRRWCGPRSPWTGPAGRSSAEYTCQSCTTYPLASLGRSGSRSPRAPRPSPRARRPARRSGCRGAGSTGWRPTTGGVGSTPHREGRSNWTPAGGAYSYPWAGGESISSWEAASSDPDLPWTLQEGVGHRNVFAVRQAGYAG